MSLSSIYCNAPNSIASSKISASTSISAINNSLLKSAIPLIENGTTPEDSANDKPNL